MKTQLVSMETIIELQRKGCDIKNEVNRSKQTAEEQRGFTMP